MAFTSEDSTHTWFFRPEGLSSPLALLGLFTIYTANTFLTNLVCLPRRQSTYREKMAVAMFMANITVSVAVLYEVYANPMEIAKDPRPLLYPFGIPFLSKAFSLLTDGVSDYVDRKIREHTERFAKVTKKEPEVKVRAMREKSAPIGIDEKRATTYPSLLLQLGRQKKLDLSGDYLSIPKSERTNIGRMFNLEWLQKQFEKTDALLGDHANAFFCILHAYYEFISAHDLTKRGPLQDWLNGSDFQEKVNLFYLEKAEYFKGTWLHDFVRPKPAPYLAPAPEAAPIAAPKMNPPRPDNKVIKAKPVRVREPVFITPVFMPAEEFLTLSSSDPSALSAKDFERDLFLCAMYLINFPGELPPPALKKTMQVHFSGAEARTSIDNTCLLFAQAMQMGADVNSASPYVFRALDALECPSH